MIWPFRPRISTPLDAADARRLAAIQARPPADLTQALATLDWCVVDIETGGLDAARDPLLAIGAVRVHGGRISLEAALEIGVAPPQTTDAANILIHGLSDSVQRAGAAPRSALLDWLEFAGSAPRIAFHAGFDQTVLQRESRAQLGYAHTAPWFDAAVIAPLLFPDAAPQCRHLDDWLDHFGIAVYARHGALADAYATAELWLVLLDALRREGITTPRQLQKLLRARRWLMAN